eukprot:760228-Hanusia_phi.AAC.3
MEVPTKHFHQVLDVVVQPLDFVVHVLVLRRHHPLRSNEMLLQLLLIPLSIVRVGRLVGIGIGQRTCCSLLVSHDYCGKCGQSEREADKDSQGTRPSWLTRLKTVGNKQSQAVKFCWMGRQQSKAGQQDIAVTGNIQR